jgi:hypothetical protein
VQETHSNEKRRSGSKRSPEHLAALAVFERSKLRGIEPDSERTDKLFCLPPGSPALIITAGQTTKT